MLPSLRTIADAFGISNKKRKGGRETRFLKKVFVSDFSSGQKVFDKPGGLDLGKRRP